MALLKEVLNAKMKEKIKIRLSGINWDGMKVSISPNSYDYSGSWVGRDFKVIS